MRQTTRILAVLLALSLGLAMPVYGDVWWPGWKRAGQAAWANFKKPAVWVPLAGTAAFGLTNADQYVSDQARENQWLFGSEQGAEDAANRIKDVALTAMVVSTIAPAPTENTGRGKRLAVAVSSGIVTWGTTEALKTAVGRERPDGGDDKSFPSLHTSDVANALMMTKRNMYAVPLNKPGRIMTDVGVYTVEALQGWARVEQGRHYPSDVLFGMALGNWMAGFFYDWFIEDPETSNLQVYVAPGDDVDSTMLNMKWSF
jgi:membrane-associated phospholipid phosphatase